MDSFIVILGLFLVGKFFRFEIVVLKFNFNEWKVGMIELFQL